MALTPNEASDVENCIQGYMQDHVNRPFGILRERGVVSELRNRLERLVFPRPVSPAGFMHYPPKPPYAASGFNRSGVVTDVLRVQQEIETAPFGTVRSGTVKQLDIAVLGQSPKLHCAANGPGDVVQWIGADSLDAAIEVKASPSVNADMKGEYVKDILALLNLRRGHPNNVSNCHFVLLDKSIGLYGQPAPSARLIKWNNQAQQNIHFRARQKPTIKHTDLPSAGLHIANTAPSQPYVEIWTIEQRSGTWQPVRYYAY